MKTRTLFAPIAAAGLCLVGATAGAAEQTWRVDGGSVTLSLFRQVIQGCQLNVVDLRQTATPRSDMEEAVGFTISNSSNLEFTALGGSYRGWQNGFVRANGGFTLKGANGTISAQDFMVSYRDSGSHNNLFMVTGKDANAPASFDIKSIKVMFDRKEKGMVFGYADLVINAHGAKQLGRPDLNGVMVGMVTVTGNPRFVGGDPNDPMFENTTPRPTGLDGTPLNGDIQLFELYDCESYGRIGTYPNGTSGFGIATTSCNVSTITGDNANWYQRMDERHPTIAMNMYRVRTVAGAGTRLEQIGKGWVKHGFLSLNSNQCGQCQTPPGGGTQLGVRCSDTYGSSLNASRNWLGPRNEVNPFTGRWECTASYFANYQNDCVNRFTTTGLSAVDHRLQVKDQDLLTANSQYFYEGYYVSENDADRYNSIGWRRSTPTWSGSQTKFNFVDNTALVHGPFAETWGQITPAPKMQPEAEGDILVGVEVTDLGSGTWHYEYIAYNHTSQRETRTFSVPIPTGAAITNVEFRDSDFDAGNEWTSSIANGVITWRTVTYAEDPEANSLKWGTLYNFRFDANVPPQDGMVGKVLFRPGTLQSLAAMSRVPQSGQSMPTMMNIERGLLLLGNENDLLFSDDSHLQVRPGPVFSTAQAPVSVVLEGTSPLANPATMTFRYEGHTTSGNIERKVEAYNFTNNQWVAVNTATSAIADEAVAINIANAGQFVQAVTNKVRVRMGFKATGPTFVYPWTARVDRAVWDIQ
ncbi:MAG: hypothetical protein ABIV13_05000 [Fimbriimonadales bacterium]